MCSELAPRAHVPDNRIPQLMQPWTGVDNMIGLGSDKNEIKDKLTHSSWSPSPQPRKVGHKKGHGPRILTAPEMPVLRMPILIL